jgi:heterogeneous nuclear ribonucleoprotein A1/A3
MSRRTGVLMNKKLFVGGLAWATNDDALRAAFEEFGAITEANIVCERDSGRSRGFGFVTFETEEGAKAAQEAMHGQELDGRELRVDFANSKPRRN